MRRGSSGLLALALLPGFLVTGCAPGDRSGIVAVATGGTGGVYYLLGGSMADRWGRELPERDGVAEVTGGSVENLSLLMGNRVEVAFSMGTNAYQAFHATGPFEGREPGQVLALAALYPNVLHLVTLEDTGVSSLSELSGRTVSVGAPGSGTEVAARTLLEANGMTYDELRPERLNFNETANALRDGMIDAGFWSVGPPTSSIMDLATARSVRIVPIQPSELARAAELDPTLSPEILPIGTYPGQTVDVSTLSTPNVLVVRADMPEELAFDLLRILLDARDALAGVHPSARHLSEEYILEVSPIPLHPGAVRHLEEEGYSVPEHLRRGP